MSDRRYLTHGLILDSELELPELRAAPPELDRVDAMVRVGRVAEPRADAVDGGSWRVADGSVHLAVPDVADYEVRRDSVVVEPHAGAPAEVIALYLLGTCLGSLLYLRGVMPVHAGAVEVDGGCVCVAGASGAGKSTVLAALVARGRRMLSDDVVAVSGEAELIAEPGYPSVKLWQDAIDGLGLTADPRRRVTPDHAKYRVDADLCPEPRPVRGVIVLRAAGAGHDVVVTSPSRLRAVRQIHRQMYRPQLGQALGRADEQFRTAVGLVEQSRVRVVTRPDGADTIDAVVDAVEQLCARLDESAQTSSSPVSASR